MDVRRIKDEDQMFTFGGILFERNGKKASSDICKHRISSAKGAMIVIDDQALLLADPDHSRK